ncbi:MAG TPA: ABC transporter ATP-binding protein [Bacteroidales bacterium]|nr:ABC transporter ATP-binding protein [Bacteroidales bacterium]
MLKTTGLTKIFRTDEVETTALNRVNFQAQQGEFVAVMGPSGCGKSTLLNIIGLLDAPSGGEYYFMDRDVSSYRENQRTDLRKGNIGFIFQSFNLIDELTVFENIELPLLYLRISAKDRKKKIEAVLERMQLTPRKNHFPQQLSGGQQQRVAIARAVVTNPKLILADEPTGNLDSSNGEEVLKLLEELNHDGTTVIMVTHSAAHAERAHRIIQLFDGHVVSENIKSQIIIQ